MRTVHRRLCLYFVVLTAAFALWLNAALPIVTAQAVSSHGFRIATYAGLAGTRGSTDGTLSDARFDEPTGLAVDSGGNVFVVELGNSVVRKITPTGVVTTIAGLAGEIGSTDGAGSAARFSKPEGIALAGDGSLYVTDTGNSTIRKVSPAGVVTTVAGLAGVAGSTDGPGATARFNGPWGIVVDGVGNVYVSDTLNFTIRKITPAGVVSTLAGTPLLSGVTDGPGPEARFFLPNGLAIGSDGTLYVGDEYNHTVRKITPGGLVSTLAGLGGVTGRTDGTGSEARFDETEDLAVDAGGNVYVVDEKNFTLRKITPAGVVTTIAGSPGVAGSADGAGTAARFDEMESITIDHAGRLYVADAGNNTIRLAIRQELVDNGDFESGRSRWSLDEESDVVWSVEDGVLHFHQTNPASTDSHQAAVFQETDMPVNAGAPLVAQFDLGNTSSVRKRLNALIVDHDFSDLSVCAFWIAPNAPLRTYQMRTHSTQRWTNAAIYFYAASENAEGDAGDYLVDNVSLQDGSATQSTARTDCVDAAAPPASSGGSSASLIANGSFDAGTLAPWIIYGDISARINGGVFEFMRPGTPAAPAGVVLQATALPMAAGQVMTATFELGNSSTMRKRIAVLLHERDFSDLTACTFWLAPGQALSPYALRGFATTAWTNATISVYAATVGPESWMRLDNVTFVRTGGVATVGTECLEPSASLSAEIR